MELGSKNSLDVEIEKLEGSTNLDKPTNIDLSTDCHNEMEGAVIIYDNDAQGGTILNVVTNSESKNVLSIKDSDDPENMITLHASTCDTQNDILEEDISKKNLDDTKEDIPNKNSETVVQQTVGESDDDETIATFITSTGQQLALYAVEDSDEIFAVALYDESGEPPSNFHFLLKADVERLIGEGAVKTVKKPPQQQKKEIKPQEKKQIIYETFEENKRKTEKLELLKKKPDVKINIVEVPKAQKVQKNKFQNLDKKNTNIIKSVNNKNFNAIKKQPILTKINKSMGNASQSRFNKKKEIKTTYIISNDNEPYIYDHLQDDFDSDFEIIEQSTVQYMLNDGDQSDSELTFDELQASLQSFKTNKSNLGVKKTKQFEHQKNDRKKDSNIKFTFKNSPNSIPVISQKKGSVNVYRTYKNPKKPRFSNNVVVHSHKQIKRELEDTCFSDFSAFEDGPNSSDEIAQNEMQNSIMIENLPSIVKVKRSRKQQLTVVNRTDSEIIIQPASVFSEEEEEPVVTKKRGRRKKKLLPDPDYNPRKPSRRSKRTHRSVEVIEIDVDENDRSNILEITLDGKKGKGSSDKENDIISLDDSDDSEEGLNKSSMSPIMQCTHCLRNFRKRKALEMHLEICQKSPASIQKLDERKRRMIVKDKKFKCKSCNEYFDIAVALARHVRAVHSPRKRGRPPKNSWLRNEDSDTTDLEDSIEESSPEPEREPKRRGRPRIKMSLSKDISPEMELKMDSSLDTSMEPRRRGRPPKKKLSKERSASPDLIEKRVYSRELTSEPRKRGRPSKKSLSKEERSVTPDLKDKSEKISEFPIQIPKKRGRPSKRNISKDESSEIIVKIEVLTDSTTNDNDTIITELEQKSEDIPEFEPYKKPRLNKDKSLVNERSLTPEFNDNIDNSMESIESPKKDKLMEEKSVKDDKVEDSQVEINVEGLIESTMESKKQYKSNKDSTSQDDESITAEINENESATSQIVVMDEKDSTKFKKKIISPNRTWKVKKLNCADCGKWFSSAAALTTHRLQHRTKTSGSLAHRCPLCKKFIALEMFTKHLSIVHGKPMSVKPTSSHGIHRSAGTVRRVLTRVAKHAKN